MRRAGLLLILAGCGGVDPYPELIPRYVVLTTLGPESPMYRSVADHARRRSAPAFIVKDLDAQRDEVLARLREWKPTYVAVFARPEEIDINLQLALFEIACRVDGDPFPDFTWGYFVAADLPSLERQLQAARGAEAKVEKKLTLLTHFEPGAEATSRKALALAWASNLPCTLLEVKEGDRESLHKHAPDVTGADFLMLEGRGGPEGLAGLPPEELRRLPLDSAAVFSGVDHTGAAGSFYEARENSVLRRSVPPDTSFTLQILRNGAAAVFAPLGRTYAGIAATEWAQAILTDEPLGWAMKESYDLAILADGAATPAFSRWAEGKSVPSGVERPAALAAARVLYGDPLLHPFVRPTTPPVRELGRSSGPEGLSISFRVEAADCIPFFTDPFSDEQRLPLKIKIAAAKATAKVATCEHESKPVPVRIAAQALEEWRGATYLRVLLRGRDLARPGLLLHLAVTLE
jgi:hypothetical protein